MAKSAKLYKDSPSLKRGEDGAMGVSKPSEADGQDMGTEGNPLPQSGGEMPVQVHQASERAEMHHKQVHEKLAMHRRHETEHAAHTGDKKDIHKRHESEMKDMHDRHHTELVAIHKRHAAGEKAKSEKTEAEPHSSKVE